MKVSLWLQTRVNVTAETYQEPVRFGWPTYLWLGKTFRFLYLEKVRHMKFISHQITAEYYYPKPDAMLLQLIDHIVAKYLDNEEWFDTTDTSQHV